MNNAKAFSRISFNFLQPFRLAERRRLKLFLVDLARKEGYTIESLTYVFCSDDHLLEMNRSFLEHDEFTDILTFDLSEKNMPITGEIYISIDRVRDNAVLFNTIASREIFRVIFHGLLHLCGYRDKTKREKETMRTKEDHYLNRWVKK